MQSSNILWLRFKGRGYLSSFDDEDTQTLVKLGLNSSQARIYLTLISLGVANARKISQTAGIDHAETYRQLEVLQKKGLIGKILGFPNEYNPINLNDGIKALFEHRNKENIEIQQKAEEMLKKGVYTDTLKEEKSKISILPDDYFV